MKKDKVMELANAKVIIGGLAYPVTNMDFIQTPGEYPDVKVLTKLNPFLAETSPNTSSNLTIKNVIFNPPATIVFWSDNTKTVVKCDYSIDAVYDPEKGLAMAIAKKTMGNNKYEYYNIFLHWLKKWSKQQTQPLTTATDDRKTALADNDTFTLDDLI